MATESRTRWGALLIAAALVLGLSACKTAPRQPNTDTLDLQAATRVIVDDLLAQAGPTILDRMVSRRVAIDVSLVRNLAVGMPATVRRNRFPRRPAPRVSRTRRPPPPASPIGWR